MTIHAYRRRTLGKEKLIAVEVEDIEDEHAFFYEGNASNMAEEDVVKLTEFVARGPVLFLITKGN